MWGLDAHGMKILTDEEVEAFENSGAANHLSSPFTMADIFLQLWPKDGTKENSLTNLRKLAKQGALKWGPFKIEEAELTLDQTTNQDFCILSMGKKKREMVFFRSES
jgi:hypothetical protein